MNVILFFLFCYLVLSGAISTILYAVLYANEIQYEALSQEARDDMYNTHRVILGYSFWFVVVIDVLFLVNLVLVYTTQLIDDPPKFLGRHRTADIKTEPSVELREGIMF